jgi:esterase/lipase
MTNADKLQVSSQMFDRGVLSLNGVMDIWNLPHVEGGDKRYIRKEYTEVSQLDQVTQLQQELQSAQAQLNATKQPTETNTEEKEDETDDSRPEKEI